MWCQNIVQRIKYMGDAEILDLAERLGEVAPEFAQHLLPVDLAIRNAVELLFQIGGEIIFDIMAEETFKKGGDHAALVFGDEAFLVEPHIGAVAQGREDRHIGRGPADAQLFQLLDDARLRNSAAAAR